MSYGVKLEVNSFKNKAIIGGGGGYLLVLKMHICNLHNFHISSADHETYFWWFEIGSKFIK